MIYSTGCFTHEITTKTGCHHTGVPQAFTMKLRTSDRLRGNFWQSSWHLRLHRHVRDTLNPLIYHRLPYLFYGNLPFHPE